MSVFLIAGEAEREWIDAYRPQLAATQPQVKQQDDPGEDLQTGLVEAQGYTLPSATVGGVFGSRNRNGYSRGFYARRLRNAPFSGAVAKLPTNVANPVQGEVGRNQRHQSRLTAGVRDQSTNYTGSLRSFAETYVGKITPIGSGLDGKGPASS